MGLFNFGISSAGVRKDNRWKYLSLWGAALLAVSFLFAQKTSSNIEKLEVHQEEQQSQVVMKANKQKTVSRKIVLPDGTKISEKIQEKETTKVSETASVKKTDLVRVKEQQSTNQTSRYRVSVEYLPSLDKAPDKMDTRVSAGARVGNLPVWVETSYDIKHRQLGVGVGVEW